MSRGSTFSVCTDGAAAGWSELDDQARAHGSPGSEVAGGVLGGDRSLCAAVRELLTPGYPVDEVVVAEPSQTYRFTEGRDTPADVAAAMLAATGGRGMLSPGGVLVLTEALGSAGPDVPEGAIF